MPKGYQAIRVDVCTSKSSRSRHSVRHAFRPAVERLLDFRKEELLGGWIRLGERRPIEIAKVRETISLIHSALPSKGTNELRYLSLITHPCANRAIGSSLYGYISMRSRTHLLERSCTSIATAIRCSRDRRNRHQADTVLNRHMRKLCMRRNV